MDDQIRGQAELSYDVAVSFAGEDRAYVEEVVQHLSGLGAQVFYDEGQEAYLWGRDLLEELIETYRSRAFRVLMFISANYAHKAWPTQERRASLERAMKDMRDPYVLVVRLDDTVIPGLPGTAYYVDGRKRTAEQVAELTMEHLRLHGRLVPPPSEQRDLAQRVAVQAIPGRTSEGRWEVPYKIHNGSPYPVHAAVLLVNDPGSPGRPEDQEGSATELVIGNIGPGETLEGRATHLHFSREPEFGELTSLAALLFSDHWGNHWAATGRDVLWRHYSARLC